MKPDDPLADRIAWTRLCPGHSSARILDISDPERRKFRVPGNWTLALFLLTLLVAILGVSTALKGQTTAALVQSALAALLAFYLLSALKPVGFDRKAQRFRNGCFTIPLSEISALQLISLTIHGGKRNAYAARELNLVLRDGRRIHVTTSRRGERLAAETAEIAAFLGGIPVWTNFS